MKKIMFFYFTVLPLIVFSQKKYFKEAIENNRQESNFYKVSIDNGKVLKQSDVEEYAKENNYIIKNFQYQDVNRFGDSFRGVKSFEFLPVSEIDAYVYEKYVPVYYHSSLSLNEFELKPKGHGYILNPKTGNFEYLEVFWTGNFDSNLISGSGTGLIKNNNEQFLFYGTFKNGKLLDKIKSFNYTYSKNNFENGLSKENDVQITNFSDNVGFYKKLGSYGIINDSFEYITNPIYSLIISNFKNEKAVVVYNGKETIIDTKGKFIDYTENQKNLDAEQKRKEVEEARRREYFKPQIDAYNNLAYEFSKMYMTNISPNTGRNNNYKFNSDNYYDEIREVTLYWTAGVCQYCVREPFEVYGKINVKTGEFNQVSNNEAVDRAGIIYSGLNVVKSLAVGALSLMSYGSDNSFSSNSSGNSSNYQILYGKNINIIKKDGDNYGHFDAYIRDHQGSSVGNYSELLFNKDGKLIRENTDNYKNSEMKADSYDFPVTLVIGYNLDTGTIFRSSSEGKYCKIIFYNSGYYEIDIENLD